MELMHQQPAPRQDIVPGRMQCAKCGFVLNRVNLYMGNGTIGAGGSEIEPCPNDGNPLLPVTWEQEARSCWKAMEWLEVRDAEAQRDVTRLTWLDRTAEQACIEIGFEMDGGVYLRLDAPGEEPLDVREKNSARAAIDAAMTARG